MKPVVLIALLALGLTAIVVVVRRSDRADADAPTSTGLTPGPHWTDEEVFRRAFWRHPTAGDRILHAQRRETTDGEMPTWQWFLAVRPSPELLTSLRDPETFGLKPTATARPWPVEPAAPEWFPASASFAAFEVLQAPVGNLTLLYNPSDNVLFATDTGGGFATAARPRNGPANSPAP